MADIAAASGGIDGSGRKNSYLYKGLSGWVAGAVGDTTLVNALLDCPVPEPRRVMWWAVTGDESSVRGIDEGFVRHIAKTYAAPSRLQTWGWCHDAHDLARSVSDYLVHAGGDATLLQLSTALGVSYDSLLALTRVNGKARSGEVKVRARLAVAPFERNWARCTRWIAAEDKRLSLRECPHADCPERLRGGRPFASHVLATPETINGQGVLCPSCRRLPVLDSVTSGFLPPTFDPGPDGTELAQSRGSASRSALTSTPAVPTPVPASACQTRALDRGPRHA